LKKNFWRGNFRPAFGHEPFGSELRAELLDPKEPPPCESAKSLEPAANSYISEDFT
jgi:hypothetical protein